VLLWSVVVSQLIPYHKALMSSYPFSKKAKVQ
jgi:hypothetical protein